MAKERLSKLQRAILQVLSDENYWEYWNLKKATAKELGRGVEHKRTNWRGNPYNELVYDNPDGFAVSFSRSVANLRKKGLVKGHIWCGRDNYMPTDKPNNQECNTRIKITERGLIVNDDTH